jgi:hypothetical protein
MSVNSPFIVLALFMMAGVILRYKVKQDLTGVVAWGFILIAYVLVIKNII